VIVPFRDKGDPWRAKNLGTVLEHLDQCGFDPHIVDDGRTGQAPFNRSAAYNRGIQAHPADVWVCHEADMLIDPEQLTTAVELAAAQPGLVVPFNTRNELSRTDTERVHRGADHRAFTPEYVMGDGRSVGAVNVVSAATMRLVGRWDEAFEGWGFDDRAMARAFKVVTGRDTRAVPGIGWHLWHVPGWSVESRFRGGAHIPPHEHEATVRNERRYRRYRRASTPDQIRALTTGRA